MLFILVTYRILTILNFLTFFLSYFNSINQRMQQDDCQCGTCCTYLVKYLMYVPVPQKLIFFRKIPRSKKRFVCQCGSGRIYFHWSHLFSLPKSIFTGQVYFVAYLVYVPVPQKLTFFQKTPRSKKVFLVNVGVAESIFTGLNYFHWPKKDLFVNVGGAKSVFTNQIY